MWPAVGSLAAACATSAETVFWALQRLQADLPFSIRGLDSDNGSEFINQILVDYCTRQGITFTRSRPYLKNDACHVKQKLGRGAPSGRLGPARADGLARPGAHPSRP
jgi:hypothetical protein